MAVSGKPEPKLTAPQTRAIAAMMTSGSVAEAAKAAKVGERTLRRWLAQDCDFCDALDAAQRQAIDAAVRRLTSLSVDATGVLARVMVDQDASSSSKVRAADIVLGRLLQLRELAQLEGRLTALEAALNVKGEKA